MAISVAWTVNSFAVTTSSQQIPFTVQTGSTVPYGTYARDLVVTNGGTASIFVSLGTGVTSASTTASFLVPGGGTALLTQCQINQSANVIGYVIGSAASTVSVGFATNVAYI